MRIEAGAEVGDALVEGLGFNTKIAKKTKIIHAFVKNKSLMENNQSIKYYNGNET